jgi:hypothetical protein
MRLVLGLTVAATAAVLFLGCGTTEELSQPQAGETSPPVTATPTPSVAGTPTPTPTLTPSATPAPTDTPVPTTSPTPGATLAYTDAEYGFGLEYPNDLTVSDLSDPSSPLSQRVLDFRPAKGHIGFAIVVADNPQNLTVEQWATEYSTCVLNGETSTSTVVIDGEDGLSCVGEPLAGKFETVVVFTRNTSIFYITSTLSDSVFDSILSGIRFSP